jgi:glycosyltransferase involved in cell wall biosynthesis
MGEDGEFSPKHRPTILFLVTEDWYFCSHRLALGRAAVDAGYDVVLATRVRDHGRVIRDAGIRLIPLPWKRRYTSLAAEAKTLTSLFRIYDEVNPDIVHHVALKPVMYGSLIARLTGTRNVINAVAGFGYSFTSSQKRAALVRTALRVCFRGLSNRPGTTVLVQNPDDRATLSASGTVNDGRLVTIPGSGVDTERFVPRDEPPGKPRVTLVSRMLWSKGVGEFVEAADLLRESGVDFEAVLVGDPDPDNLQSIPAGTLRGWAGRGSVTWRGHAEDVAAEWARSNVAVLPSHREGLPKTLLEAAACGRPIVTTDVPGCREAVRHGENGLLVPVCDPRALAAAIARLIDSPDLRRRMGARSRAISLERFSEKAVIGRILDLYRSILEEPRS